MVKGWWRFHGSFKPFQSNWCSYTSVLFYCIQRKNLTKKSPVIMPIVTEDFNIEKYAHVDALLANFQGVFLNQVTCVQFFFLTTAESVLFAVLFHALLYSFPPLSPAFLLSSRHAPRTLRCTFTSHQSFPACLQYIRSLRDGHWLSGPVLATCMTVMKYGL